MLVKKGHTVKSRFTNKTVLCNENINSKRIYVNLKLRNVLGLITNNYIYHITQEANVLSS